ncbi:MAG: DUF6249 domain-containing protein [Tannerellaceae bacterium]
MFDFLTPPLVTFVIFYSIYCIFDLFVRRKERMEIIERMGDKLDPDLLKPSFGFKGKINFSFSSLKLGALLTGIGLGIFVGSILCVFGNPQSNALTQSIMGGSLLLFGGLGLIVAFVIELKMSNKKNH